MKPDYREIILYQSDDGQAVVNVHLADETVWLTLNQMSERLNYSAGTNQSFLGISGISFKPEN